MFLGSISRKCLPAIAVFGLFVLSRPAAASPMKIQVIATGGADACIYNFPGPPLYSCAGGGLAGSFTFDTATNSVVGSWSIDWGNGLDFFQGTGNAVVSGTNLYHDVFDLDGLVFADLQLIAFPCPIGNGRDFCTAHASLISVPTPEPSSLLLVVTGLGLLAVVDRFV